jgi:hypothetical protein
MRNNAQAAGNIAFTYQEKKSWKKKFKTPTSNGKYSSVINKNMQRSHSRIPGFGKPRNRFQGQKIKLHHLQKSPQH